VNNIANPEARDAAILRIARDPYVELDDRGIIRDWNSEAEKVYGWKASEVLGLHADVLIPEEERAPFSRLLQTWLASSNGVVLDEPLRYEALRKNGETFPAEITAVLLRSDAQTGSAPGLGFFARDLSEQRQMQRALRENEQRYEALVDNIEDGYFEVDRAGRYLFVNESFCKIFGYAAEEMLGESYKTFLGPDIIPRIREVYIAVWRTGVPVRSFEFEISRKDGEKRIVEDSVSLKRDHWQSPVGFHGIRRDVTERQIHEKAMLASEARWRDLFERASDLVYTCDSEGRLTGINRAAERLTGYSQAELLGRRAADLLLPEFLPVDQQLREDWEHLRYGCVYEREILAKDSRRVPIEVSVSPLFESGNAAGMMGIARDITARRRAERFEQGRSAILEDVARDAALFGVLRRVESMVESEIPGSVCKFSSDLVPGTDSPESSHPDETPSEWSTPVLSAAGTDLGRLRVRLPKGGTPDSDELHFLDKVAQLAALTIEHRHLTDQLAFQARHDALTGLPNRVLLEERIKEVIALARKQMARVAVLWLDLDRFKQINDSVGHRAGDLLLQYVAQRLVSRLNPPNMISRLGGDEFAIVNLITADSPDQIIAEVSTFARSLLDALKTPVGIAGHDLFVSGSIGISMFPEDGVDADSLLRKADLAMYNAKGQDRGQFRFYAGAIGEEEAERREIELQLRLSLEQGRDFSISYQPQCKINGELVGVEALLRFNHPTMGVIPPVRFIPIAEASGLIGKLGYWALREVCRQGVEWRSRGFEPVRLSVNVSALQFSRADFAEQVGEVLSETGMPAAGLELELTETAVMQDVIESSRQMKKLRSLGVSLAIDDFGTGYSSLSYLHHLEIDRIKIDQSFISELGSSSATLPVVEAIIALARSLNVQVIGEGVESEDQLRVLWNAGCEVVQGYFFSRPVTSHAVERFFRRTSEDSYLRVARALSRRVEAPADSGEAD
jgi:diguanylate cyclase (GGDEF)-like protein/PAS domain S-box-containing protein